MDNIALMILICISVAISDGYTYALPIILNKVFSDIFNRNIVLTIFTGALFLSCLIYTGLRKMTAVSSFKLSLQLFALSLIATVMIPMSTGVLGGLSCGLVFYSGLVICLMKYSNPAFVTGLYTASSSIGAIIIPFAVGLGIERISWITIILTICVLILLLSMIPLSDTEDTVSVEVKGEYSLIGAIALVLFNLITHLTFFVPYIFIYNHLVLTQSSLSLYYISILNICQVPGRFLTGVIVSNGWISAIGINLIATIGLLVSFILCYISDTIILPASILMSLSLAVISCSVGLTTRHIASGDKINLVITAVTLGRGIGVFSSTMFGSIFQSIRIVYIMSIGSSILALISIVFLSVVFRELYGVNVSVSKSSIVRSVSKHSVADDSAEVFIRV